MKGRMPGLPRFLLALLLASPASAFAGQKPDLHQQLLDLAERQQKERRAHFAAATSKAALETLQQSLRAQLLKALGGLPQSRGAPPARILGKIEAEDYVIDK